MIVKNDCNCKEKKENWTFVDSLSCWYVERECDHCQYYWEGPNYLWDDPKQLGNTLE